MNIRQRNSKKRVPSMPIIHDRRSTDLLRNVDVGAIEVDDPYDPEGGKIVTLRNLRDDPLARLHTRQQIDEAQFQSGRRFQHDWETAERGPRAIDPSKEAVDGGMMLDPISESQQKAIVRLNEAIRHLGVDGSAIIMDVLVHGRTMEQIAFIRRLSGEKWHVYFGKRFRECLDCLSYLYGLAQRPYKI